MHVEKAGSVGKVGPAGKAGPAGIVSPHISVTSLPREKKAVAEAARVAAGALRDNPTHIAMHGDNPEKRYDGLYVLCRGVLANASSPPLHAVDQYGRIVGVLNAAPPGHCKPTLLQQVRMVPAMFHLSADTLRRMAYFGTAWAAYDPKTPHWHLGPVAVLPERQGLGIGSMMMSALCRRLDDDGAYAYLETDTEANVRFYRRFGFDVIGTLDVSGVCCWFMQRSARREPRGS